MYIFLIQFLRPFSRLFQFIRDQPGSMETIEPRLITIQNKNMQAKFGLSRICPVLVVRDVLMIFTLWCMCGHTVVISCLICIHAVPW